MKTELLASSDAPLPLYRRLGFHLGMLEVRGWKDFFSRFCILVYMSVMVATAIIGAIFIAHAFIEQSARQRYQEFSEKQELKQLRLDVDEIRGVDECQP